MQLDDQTRAFLAYLHRGGTMGYWWVLEGQRSTWWNVATPAALPTGNVNIYFGVHPTNSVPPTNAKGEHRPATAVRSQISVIAAVNCLFVEYDAKDFSGDKNAALAKVESLEPPPSVVVDSGGGYHCYWFLADTFSIDSDDARTRAVQVQAAWVRYHDADPQSKDLARVLRVPGTHNRKYTPSRLVTFVRCDLETVYDLGELGALCHHLVESAPKAEAAELSDDERLRIIAGQRFGGAVGRVRAAPDGKKHDTLLDAAIELGGFVPMRLLTETEIENALFAAVETRADDAKNARQTIRDGIVYGKAKPWRVRDLLRPRTAQTAATQPAAPVAVDSAQLWAGGVTLAQLQHKEFPPERWIIENIFPEGACLVAAKYKSRKSWMALALAIAIAMGGKALGRLDVSPGRVLYLDLEGKQQRIQKRARAMLGVRHVQWPENFHIFTKWPQGDEGLAQLENWYKAFPDTALTVVDVLASFRRPIQKYEEPYRYDRDTVDPLNELFERYHSGGMLIHHFNKGKHDDIMDSITGTTGLPSAVNTMWGLSRDPNNSDMQILNLRGRDLENEDPLGLRWDSFLNCHVIEGPATEVATSAERRAVLQVLSDDVPRQPKEIAAELNKTVAAVQQLLRKLLNDGAIDKAGYGKYAIVRKANQSDHTDQSDQSGKSSKSDRHVPTLIAPSNADQSSVNRPNGVNGHSDHSDRYIYGSLIGPPQVVGRPVNGVNHTVWRLKTADGGEVIYPNEAAAIAALEAQR